MAISSPCVRNCCLDEKDICLGCGRSIEEIIRWGDVADKEKLQILMASKNVCQSVIIILIIYKATTFCVSIFYILISTPAIASLSILCSGSHNIKRS